jgi:dUTP pyrophosphatase
MIPILIKKMEGAEDLNLPTYGTPHSAGVDLLAAVDGDVTLRPETRALIPTGVAIALPEGYEAQIRPRSGLALKYGVTVLNAPGTIDADYRGEIKVILVNHGSEDFIVTRGMKIAQMLVGTYTKICWDQVKNLDSTNRGDGGFGSTGLFGQNT